LGRPALHHQPHLLHRRRGAGAERSESLFADLAAVIISAICNLHFSILILQLPSSCATKLKSEN
jgi:hypothetical protein